MATASFNASTPATGEPIWPSRLNGRHGPADQAAAEPADDGAGTEPPAAAAELTNAPTFQDDADAVMRLGPIISSFKRIGLAIRDPRCKRHHLRVLYAFMEKLSRRTGTAFPSRRVIGEQEGLQYEVVENALYDLRRWGYIDWEKRAEPEMHKGTLLHYTLPVLTWTEEQLTSAILELRSQLRGEPEYTTGSVHNGACTQRGVSESTPPVVTRNLKRELEDKYPAQAAHEKRGEPAQPPKPSGWTPPTKAEIDAGFEVWWPHYPRKEDKLDARKAYGACLTAKDAERRATIAQLLAAVKACRFPSDPKFRKLPATWLNKGSWKDVSAQSADRALTFEEELQALQDKHPDVPIEQLRQAVTDSRRARGLD